MDWERTRAFFPAAEQAIPLDHAGRGPLSARAAEALVRYARAAGRAGALAPDAFEEDLERVRRRAARLLGARPDEVAFVGSTTEGLGLVARSLPWQRGDRVLTSSLEYVSNVSVWLGLRGLGVETVLLPEREGRLDPDDLAEALDDPSIRLVSLSSVSFASGDPLDLARAGRLCGERGVLFCVDAIQSLGLLPVDVRRCGIDFLAAAGHKWLCGPQGAGLLYVARERLEALTPPILGWRSLAEAGDAPPHDVRPHPSARRFEAGTPNVPGTLALGAALDLALELGVERIAGRVDALVRHLERGLRELGAEIVAPRPPERRSGILAFRPAGEEAERAVARLRRAGIVARVRRGAVRLSPHYYLREAELDRALEVLAGRRAAGPGAAAPGRGGGPAREAGRP